MPLSLYLAFAGWVTLFYVLWRRRRGHHPGNPLEIINQLYLGRPTPTNPNPLPPVFDSPETEVVPRDDNPRSEGALRLPHHPEIGITLSRDADGSNRLMVKHRPPSPPQP